MTETFPATNLIKFHFSNPVTLYGVQRHVSRSKLISRKANLNIIFQKKQKTKNILGKHEKKVIIQSLNSEGDRRGSHSGSQPKQPKAETTKSKSVIMSR